MSGAGTGRLYCSIYSGDRKSSFHRFFRPEWRISIAASEQMMIYPKRENTFPLTRIGDFVTSWRLIVLFACIVSPVLLSGCVGQPALDDSMNNLSDNASAVTSIITPEPTQCPARTDVTPVQSSCPTPADLENTSYSTWITIDKTGDHIAGGKTEITGTIQNRNGSIAEEKISVDLFTYQVSFDSPAGAVSVHGHYPLGVASIQDNNCIVKPWVVKVNLSGNLSDGQYLIQALTSEQTVSQIFNIRTFAVGYQKTSDGITQRNTLKSERGMSDKPRSSGAMNIPFRLVPAGSGFQPVGLETDEGKQ